MFGTQALRLMRETWPTPTMLAQELYAMFNDDIPTSSGPIAIDNPNPNGPGLTINNTGGSGDSLTFGNGAGDTVTLGVDPNGNLTQKQNNGQPQPVSGGGGGVPAQVVSGSGSSYQIKVYPNGLSGTTLTVAATQLSIDPAETIPAGTWTTAVQAGGAYFIQVPVWGAP